MDKTHVIAAVAENLSDLKAQLEFPGCVVIPTPDGRSWWFGTANEYWMGDLHADADCGQQPQLSLSTNVSSDSDDVAQIAAAIRRLLRTLKGAA